MNRFQMRARHGENVRGPLDQVVSQRLTAKSANLHAFFLADLHGIKTRRLPAHRMNARGRDLDVFAITDKPAEKPFCNRASTNISCANKEDVFHSHSGGDDYST